MVNSYLLTINHTINLKPETRNQEPGTRNRELGTGNSEPETSNLKPIENQPFKTQQKPCLEPL